MASNEAEEQLTSWRYFIHFILEGWFTTVSMHLSGAFNPTTATKQESMEMLAKYWPTCRTLLVALVILVAHGTV